MKIKITFSMPNKAIAINNQKMVNSVFHRILGKDNPYHDKMSEYAVSNLQGGNIVKGSNNLVFKENPYIIVSAPNASFISDVFMKAVALKGVKDFFYDTCIEDVVLMDNILAPHYDIVYTISPILLKRDGRKICCEDDGYMEYLETQCRKKLAHLGIDDETFGIEWYKKENSKKKVVYVGDVFNVCSRIAMIVRGKAETRRTIYDLGFGNSTGSGFGSVRLAEKY